MANKTMKNFILLGACVATMAGGLISCTAENPFGANDGEGLVKMNVSVNSTVTRAIEGEYAQALLDTVQIRISNDKGLLYKWRGMDQVPAEGVYLRYGSYKAEAWSGDSASASFDKKFFKGVSDFDVNQKQEVTTVSINCKIANVVASVDEATIESDKISDVNVNVSMSRGNLDFNADNFADKGYFMMPFINVNGEMQRENTLTFTVTGKDSQGNEFTPIVKIVENVEGAHEYRAKFKFGDQDIDDGGAFFKIVIEDEIIDKDEYVIFGKPQFSWLEGEDLDAQIIGTPGTFTAHTLCISAFKGFESIELEGVGLPQSPINIASADLGQSIKEALTNSGITTMQNVSASDPNLHRFYITLGADWFNNLPASETELVLNVTVKDGNNKSNSYSVKIANTEDAIANPAPIELPDFSESEEGLMAVGATSVSIPVEFKNLEVDNPALQYRAEDESEWTTVSLTAPQHMPTRATSIKTTVTLRNLRAGVKYLYRVVAGALVDGKYEFESEPSNFETETMFTIPNSSMEDWSTFGSKNIIFPGPGSVKSFWDTGNEGANMAGAVLTTGSSDMFHSGAKSAKLESKFASVFGIGKLAAGNIFVGTYDKTSGTNGELTFGRPYDGSHPTKLRVWANYRPGKVDQSKKTTDPIPAGFADGEDHGQIYIALTTEAVSVKTASESTLFNKDADYVIAYGEQTWTAAFGPDGGLAEVNIPIEYRESAKTVKPTHLVIVCSASKYGDYFTGSSTSVMYVDDFELVYE